MVDEVANLILSFISSESLRVQGIPHMNSFVEQIPDIQYDTIARIVPGVVLLTAYSAHNPQLWGSTGYVAAGLFLSYVVGFMLELFSATVVDWKLCLRGSNIRRAGLPQQYRKSPQTGSSSSLRHDG